MAAPFRIVDLNSYTGLVAGVPSGNEIAEISNAGAGSFQVPIAVLASARAPITISVGGTTNLLVTQFGDVLVKTNSAVTINLPTALQRSGVPVSVIAATSAPNITIAPFAGQTILGSSSSLTITNSYGAYTLWPDASATGDWYQK